MRISSSESRALLNERYGIGASDVEAIAEGWRNRALDIALECERLRTILIRAAWDPQVPPNVRSRLRRAAGQVVFGPMAGLLDD